MVPWTAVSGTTHRKSCLAVLPSTGTLAEVSLDGMIKMQIVKKHQRFKAKVVSVTKTFLWPKRKDYNVNLLL